jgi:hypothetical protein
MARSNPKTAADERFEAYLTEQGIAYVYEPDWAEEFGTTFADNPDFFVDPDGGRVVAEVKQFETTRIGDRLAGAGGTATLSDREVFGAIRSKVTNTARDQLRQFDSLGLPLAIVLANPLGADVMLDFFHIAHALLGNPKVRMKVGPDVPPDDPPEAIGEDYGAFLSVRADGEIVNHHPHVSAVMVVHERLNREDWIERILAEEPDVDEFSGKAEAMLHYLMTVERREAEEGSPKGAYHWVDVYDLAGNPTAPGFSGEPLARSLFNGPRDRWFGFREDRFEETT